MSTSPGVGWILSDAAPFRNLPVSTDPDVEGLTA